MGHRKYAALQEAAKQCEKTDSVRRSGRSTKRSQTVADAIDDELHARRRGRAAHVGICYATERRAAVVPPVEGSTIGYACIGT